MHSVDDLRWVLSVNDNVKDIVCIEDPESLLRFYAGVDRLLSFRLHATIPALSVGVKVCNVYMDSRYLTTDIFGIPSVDFTALQDKSFIPEFTSCDSPDLDTTIKTLSSVTGHNDSD